MPSQQATILVVEDEPSIAGLLSEDLAGEGYNCVTAATGEDALEKLSNDCFDALLLDLRLPGISGIDVLKEVKLQYPETMVLVVTAVGDTETAVEAMKIGAVDYITKPFQLGRINSGIAAALKIKATGSGRVTTVEKGVETGSEETNWACRLDDIAIGVEARLDSLTGHMMTKAVIDRTTGVARNLGIPENEIKEWADTRRKRAERINILDSLLEQVA